MYTIFSSHFGSKNLVRIIKDQNIPIKEIDKTILQEIEQIEEKNKNFVSELSEQDLHEVKFFVIFFNFLIK